MPKTDDTKVDYPVRYSRCPRRAIGDLVRVLDDGYSHLDGGLVVRLKIGLIGKVVMTPDMFGLAVIDFDGKNHWVDPKLLTRVEILDILAGL